MNLLYDRIGVGYVTHRRPDPRIEAQVRAALGQCDRVLNVGAGAGSYEPANRFVIAVEPSAEMIRQRRLGAAPVVQASASRLPFRDLSFDAALAVLTVHHWPDGNKASLSCDVLLGSLLSFLPGIQSTLAFG